MSLEWPTRGIYMVEPLSSDEDAALTVEKIREMFRSLPKHEPDPLLGALLRPLRPSFAGLDVIERSPPPPKIETSARFKQAFPQAAAELDVYLLQRFGRRRQDTNIYHFVHYLSVPFGVLRNPNAIIGDFTA